MTDTEKAAFASVSSTAIILLVLVPMFLALTIVLLIAPDYRTAAEERRVRLSECRQAAAEDFRDEGQSFDELDKALDACGGYRR